MKIPTLIAPSLKNEIAAVSPHGVPSEDLVRKHEALVRAVAKRIFRRLPNHVRGFEEDDLYSVGMLGLFEAHARYEERPDATFEAFAEYRIKGAILDEVRRHDFFPRRLRAKANELQRATRKLEGELKRPPTQEELACELGLEVGELERLQSRVAPYRFVEHDMPSLDLRSAADRQDAVLAQKQRQEILVAVLRELPEREQTVLDLYFNKELKLREIADILGVTEGRVCQIKSEALERARKRLVTAGVTPD